MTFMNLNKTRELASRAINMRVTTGAEVLPERLKLLFFLNCERSEAIELLLMYVEIQSNG